jgi:hypothetical protein
MSAITTRVTSGTGAVVKNAPLTNAEIDTNFINLNVDKVETADAVSTNTVNKVVKRDGSGNFSAGTITATLNGSASSAGIATNLAGGSVGSMYYQTAADTTASLAPGTSGQIIRANGAAAPTWMDQSSVAAGTAVSLANSRTINGTNFNGTANITTASWGTARTATIGATGKSVDGSADFSWTVAEVLGTAANAQVNSLGVGTSASGTAGQIRATNTITAFYSDRRLKTEVSKIENALDKIEELTGVIYTQNKLAENFGYNNYEEQVGLYAQDVQKVQPQAVKPAPFDIDADGNSTSGENYLTVQYDRLIPLIVEAIKELRAEVKAIKG